MVHWKKLLEDSEIFICAVNEGFFLNPKCIEQVIYAKSLNKPIALVIEKNTEFKIPDLFESANIVLRLEYIDAQDLKKKGDLIIRALNGLKNKKILNN